MKDLATLVKAEKIREGLDYATLKALYLKIIKLAGIRNFHEADVRADIVLLQEQLKKHFGGLTMAELQYLSEKGVLGEYGEFYGVNPGTFVKWIRAYLNSHERKMALREAKTENKALPQSKTLSPDQKQKTWNEAKERYRHSGLVQGGVWLYGLGLDLGKINVQDELFIEEVRYNAQKTFEKRIEALKAQRLLQKRTIKELQAILEAEPEERSQNKTWIDQCKREAVKLIFKSEIENN